MHRSLWPSLLSVVLSCALPAMAADSDATLEADLERFVEWFAGDFDNYAQTREEEAEEVEEPHGRIHSIFAPVDFPALGEYVFYVEQYADGDPSKIYRQRFYQFGLAPDEGAIELVIYAPPDPAAVAGAHLDPSKLDGLEVEALTSYPGCEVYWKAEGPEAFIGYTKEGACRVKSRRSGRTLVISDDLRLTPDEIWIRDRAVDAEGNYVYGHKGGIHHKLRRTRPFRCWAAAPKEAAEGEDAGWDLWRPLELHDQGGRVALEAKEDRPQTWSVELFQARYRGENQVDVLELAIRENGKDRSIAYAWADPSSKRIGLNLRTLQVGCTLHEAP